MLSNGDLMFCFNGAIILFAMFKKVDISAPPELSKIYSDFIDLLNDIEREETSALSLAKRTIVETEKVMEQLKQYINAHPFENQSEEIYFFKFLKPHFSYP